MRRLAFVCCPLLLAAACSEPPSDTVDSDTFVDEDTTPVDQDSDGAFASVDCDDLDADERPGVTWYADADGDGHGDPDRTNECERGAPSDVRVATDCDDSDADEHPGAFWYPDLDGDGFGGFPHVGECERLAPSDVGNRDDCDDQDGERYPGVTWYQDADGDGYGDPDAATDCRPYPGDGVLNNGDCDDTNARINPDEPELTDNGIDEDCDGSDRGVAEQLMYALLAPQSSPEVYRLRTLGVSSTGAWVIGDDFVTAEPSCTDCGPNLVSNSTGTLYFGSNGSGRLLTINEFDSDGRPSTINWNRMPLGLVAHGLVVGISDVYLHGWGDTTSTFAEGALSTSYISTNDLVSTGNAGLQQFLPQDLSLRLADGVGTVLIAAEPPLLSRVTYRNGFLRPGPSYPVPLASEPTHILHGEAPWWYLRDRVSGLVALEYIEDESPPYLEALTAPLSLADGELLEWWVEGEVLVTVESGALTTVRVDNHSQFTRVDSEPIPHTIAHIAPAVGGLFVGTAEGAIWRVGASPDGQLQDAIEVVPAGGFAVVGLVAAPVE